MRAEEMWKVSTGKHIKVAVVDTGIDSSTPSLRGQVLPGKNVSGSVGSLDTDKSGHGTTMAELIAGTGRSDSLKGLAPDAKIIPIRISLKGGDGKGHPGSAIEGVRAAADSDAQIISMSIGNSAPDTALLDAVKYAVGKGKLLLASTGNDGDKRNEKNFPAAYAYTVGVAATDESGTVADFSNSASDAVLSAPGVDIPSWCDEARKRYCDGDGGTSAATALASASAALLWSKHPDWTANQVLRVLIETAGLQGKNVKPSKYIGHGSVRPRINLLEGKGDPGDPAISPLTNKRIGPAAKKKTPDSSKSENADGAPDKVKAADSSSGDEKGSVVLPAVSVAVGVAVLVGCGFAVVRLRRN